MTTANRGLVLAAIPLFLLLVGLGTWQVQRLAWKEGLIATVNARMAAPAVAFEALDAAAMTADPGAFAFRPVILTGRIVDARRMALLNRVLEERAGVHLVAPLVVAGGEATVLVDLGWAPDAASALAAPLPNGRAQISGVLRAFPEPGWFTPANDPARGAWYIMEAKTMMAGLARPAPLYVVALPDDNAPGPGLIRRRPLANLRNDHLQYAITWYALALALVTIVAIKLAKPRAGERSRK